MKTHFFPAKFAKGFTLVEALAVIATVGLLACLAIPALAHARMKSPAAGCLSTMRQLMVGWQMYKEDNSDSLMPNSTGSMSDNTAWVSSKALDWYNSLANTNRLWILDSLMAPYVNNDVRPYRCPADVIPSANGIRLRSRSMNCQMGFAAGESANAGWERYTKGSDLTCPTPANTWVFCDESMWSLNDGYLQLNLSMPDYPDVPANYHGNACGFSFADGHAEDHPWISHYITALVQQYGFSRGGSVHWGSSSQDADWTWLTQHAACNHR